MTTQKELRRLLDTLPPNTPANIDPDLARLHTELHKTGETDEGIPRSYISTPGMNDIGRLITDLSQLQPTHLQNALENWDNLMYQTELNLFTNWAKPVLDLLGIIYREHYPADKIRHKI